MAAGGPRAREEGEGDDDAEAGLLGNGDELVLRECSHEPIELLQELHNSIFPIRFEPAFFSHLATGRFQTLGAYRGGVLIGMVVWDIVPSWRADRHDGPLFSRLIGSGVRPHDLALYIMTLGVRQGQRGKGLGRALLDACLCAARAQPCCVCAYLHVIVWNKIAIDMYESSGFLRLNTLVGYYSADSFVVPTNIDGADADAHTFVLYMHGSVPPVSFALLRSCKLACSILATVLCTSSARDFDTWRRRPSRGATAQLKLRAKRKGHDNEDETDGDGMSAIDSRIL